MSLEGNTLPAGYVLHWYEIESVIGRGGFGITYLANDTNLAQKVAIKEYFPGHLALREDTTVSARGPEVQEDYDWGLSRFVAEAQTLAQFKHPAIVPVYTTFSENQTAYMVMELITGESCTDSFKHGKYLSEEWILLFLDSLLDGLRLVHERGFIHRDIKPDNIFLRPDHSPVLLDFGSARMAVESKTQSLTALVTPGFAPFEQYHTDEDAGRQGPWTDLYSLAATCYVAVAGKRRLPDALARINALISDKPDPLPSAVEIGAGRFSEEFLQALDFALNVQPEDRPQSVDEWLEVLPIATQESSTGGTTTGGGSGRRTPITGRRARGPATQRAAATRRAQLAAKADDNDLDATVLAPGNAADDETVLASQPGTAPKRRLPIIVAAVVGVAVLGAAGVGYVLTRSEPPTQPVAPSQPAVAVPAPATTPAVEQDPEQIVRNAKVVALVAQARAAMLDGRLAKPPQRNALEFYQQALAIDPQNVAAQQGMGKVIDDVATSARRAIAQEEFGDADELLTVIRAANPDHTSLASLSERLVAARESVARTLQDEEQLAESVATAIANGREALAERRLDAPPGNNALEYFNSALKLAPANADARAGIRQVVDAYVQQASTAVAAEDLDAASASIASAAAIDPDNADVVRVAATVATLRDALQLRASAERVAELLSRAAEHRAAGRIAGPAGRNAFETYQRVLALDPNNSVATQALQDLPADLIALAETAIAEGAVEVARARLATAADIMPADAALRARLGRVQEAARNKLDAQLEEENRIRELLELAANDLAAARLTEPAGGNALERYQQVLALKPGDADARDGIDKVAERLVALSNEAVDARSLERAQSYLDAAASASASAPGLAEARDRLQQARTRQARVAELVSSGQSQVRNGRLTSPPGRNALEDFRAALALDPDNAAARDGLSKIVVEMLRLADAALDKGQLDEARTLQEQAANIATPADAVRLAAARAAYEAKLTAVAAAERTAQVRQILQAADVALKTDRLSTPSGGSALEAYRQVLRLDPGNAVALAGIERVAERHVELVGESIAAGNLDLAAQHLKSAEESGPQLASLAPARDRLQTARAEQQRREQAELARRQRIDALLLEGETALAAGRLSQPAAGNALQHFRAVLELEPGNEAAETGIEKVARQHLERAGAAIAAREFDAAETELAASAAIAPTSPGLEAARGRLASAREQLRMEQTRARISDLVARADGALRRGRLSDDGDGALALYREALGLEPDNEVALAGVREVFDALVQQAESALRSADFASAASVVQKALEIRPDSNELAALRARIATARADEAERQQLQARVRQLTAEGEARLAKGNDETALDAAASQFRDALKLSPKDEQASAGLDRVVAGYEGLVETALVENRFAEAEALIEAARNLVPSTPWLTDADAKIAAARKAAKGAAEQLAGIKTLLAQGEEHLVRYRLTTPPGGNAVENYREVLAIEPDNVEAKSGLERVVERYMVLAERASARKNDVNLRRYLDAAASVIPDFGESKERAAKLLAVLSERSEQAQKLAEQREAAQAQSLARVQELVKSADAHLDAGRLDRAAADARSALQIDGGNRDASRILAAAGSRRKQSAPAQTRPQPPAKRPEPPKQVARVNPDPPKPVVVPKQAPRAPEKKRAPGLSAANLTTTWCAGALRMRLTNNQWTFLVQGGNLQFPIERFEAGSDSISVYWVDDKNQPMVTQFGRFSSDGRSMVQLRGKRRSDSGWSQYNRSFSRCG